jgi:hypothetical protein
VTRVKHISNLHVLPDNSGAPADLSYLKELSFNNYLRVFERAYDEHGRFSAGQVQQALRDGLLHPSGPKKKASGSSAAAAKREAVAALEASAAANLARLNNGANSSPPGSGAAAALPEQPRPASPQLQLQRQRQAQERQRQAQERARLRDVQNGIQRMYMGKWSGIGSLVFRVHANVNRRRALFWALNSCPFDANIPGFVAGFVASQQVRASFASTQDPEAQVVGRILNNIVEMWDVRDARGRRRCRSDIDNMRGEWATHTRDRQVNPPEPAGNECNLFGFSKDPVPPGLVCLPRRTSFEKCNLCGRERPPDDRTDCHIYRMCAVGRDDGLSFTRAWQTALSPGNRACGATLFIGTEDEALRLPLENTHMSNRSDGDGRVELTCNELDVGMSTQIRSDTFPPFMFVTVNHDPELGQQGTDYQPQQVDATLRNLPVGDSRCSAHYRLCGVRAHTYSGGLHFAALSVFHRSDMDAAAGLEGRYPAVLQDLFNLHPGHETLWLFHDGALGDHNGHVSSVHLTEQDALGNFPPRVGGATNDITFVYCLAGGGGDDRLQEVLELG